MRTVSVDGARRIALGAQGFGGSPVAGRVDVRHFRRVMRTLGLVQLDSVNVAVRTHYMPFYSRLGPYDRNALDTWLNRSGEHFEYWAHEAAVLPVDRQPLWRWKMATIKPWSRAVAFIAEHPGIVERVLEQVRDSGPLTVSDLDGPSHRNTPWWGYGPAKVVLEHLFDRGEVTALRTGKFMRLYDIPERMLPTRVLDMPTPTKDEAYRKLLREAVRHHGIGTASDIADYYRLHIPTARPMLAALADAQEIIEVQVPGWKGPVYLDPDATRPRSITATTLLSPFDPVVWCRPRVERLFGFRYRIEIYVPEKDRIHGYYVFPFLLDGDLVARVDLKADRAAGKLLVRSAFAEAEVDRRTVARALAPELERFAAWLGLNGIRVDPKGDLAPDLAMLL
ncbi:MAG TPA: crosslink repair DNA glycosylase YcaQ family protein [Acidimicrobiia bacterium]|nr:crosslink repair DNA glycosylase YcaQ family protein [Acidimicrobiia bacterium]